MTATEINKAIAEICDWYPYQDADNKTRWKNRVTKSDEDECPNYYGDLNAMHEAENGMNQHKTGAYNRILFNIVKDTTPNKYWWHATAPQRCEAFLRTFDKWESE